MTLSNPIELTYHRPPAFFPIYRRLLLGKRAKYTPGAALPHFRSTWTGARADAALVRRYCEACALPFDGFYPLLYPHILTSAIHLDMISRPEFPLSPMGAVHTRMHILQHRPIPVDAALDIECRLTETRILKQGVEFEITTTLSLDGAVCWESLSANLIRGKKFGDPVEPSPLAQLPDLEGAASPSEWDVPKNMGWRYARITGDFNPIHVSRVMAKFMGFERDLIHGMWSAARCVSHLNMPGPEGPVRLDLLFKGPVYMESHVALKVVRPSEGTPEAGDPLHGDTDQLFDLYCGDNPRPVIRGYLRPAGPDGALVTVDKA